MLRGVYAMTGRLPTAICRGLLAVLVALMPLPAVAVEGGPNEGRISELSRKAAKIELGTPGIDPEAAKAAEDLAKRYQSPGFQRRLQEERERLLGLLFRRDGQEGACHAEGNRGDGGRSGSLLSGGRIYIFASSSIPLGTLRNYAADMERLGDPSVVLVLRGFVEGPGRIGPTAKLAAEILKTDPACEPMKGDCSLRDIPFIVDPTLFRKFGISQVPAIVFAPDQGEALTALGDASLGYILRRFAEEGSGKALSAAADKLERRRSPQLN